MSLLALFCDVDDFSQAFEQCLDQHRIGQAIGKRGPKPALSLSEMIMIIIHFHQSNYRHFKAYYTELIMVHLKSEFPNLVSYNRFVELMPGTLLPLTAYLCTRLVKATGIAIIDSTPLAVCHNRRIGRHHVFAGLAARGETSMGWFYGFKLHLIVSDQGQLITLYSTPGNVDDRKHVPHMTKKLWGKQFVDQVAFHYVAIKADDN